MMCGWSLEFPCKDKIRVQCHLQILQSKLNLHKCKDGKYYILHCGQCWLQGCTKQKLIVLRIDFQEPLEQLESKVVEIDLETGNNINTIFIK